MLGEKAENKCKLTRRRKFLCKCNIFNSQTIEAMNPMKKNPLLHQPSKTFSAAFATSVLATALVSLPPVAYAGSATERCADVVKSGKNDCAIKALGTSCQGSATEDNVSGAWIKVPAGTCGNIVAICAGTAEAPEDTDAKRLAKSCSKIADQNSAEIVGGRIVDKFGESI